jgi:hypothetical protein
MVSQEFQGEFIRENVVENLYTAFGYIERFSENKIVPCCFGTAEILLCACAMFRFKNLLLSKSTLCLDLSFIRRLQRLQ